MDIQDQVQGRLEFINSTPVLGPDAADRKRIKSHVLRARNRRGKHAAQKSWLNPELSRLPNVGPMSGLQVVRTHEAIAIPFCPDLEMLEFPHKVDISTLRDMHTFLTSVKTGLSPFEACMQVQLKHDHILSYVQDPLLFQLLLFQARNYVDRKYERDARSYVASLHLGKVLQLLQLRLCSLQAGTSDITVLVVAALTMAAHDGGNESAALKHIAGLHRIVELRGGIKSMTHNDHRMQRKVCRVDLSVALRFGRKPLFLRDDIDWNAYGSDKNSIRKHKSDTIDECEHEVDIWIQEQVDLKLQIIYSDLKAFSRLAEVAFQVDRTLDPSFVNEIIISTMYRLLHLSYSQKTANGILRLGILAYAITVFLQDQLSSERYRYIADELRLVVTSSHACFEAMPAELKLWIVYLLQILGSKSAKDAKFFDDARRLNEEMRISQWLDARAIMKSVMWISFVHDRSGQAIWQDSRRDIDKRSHQGGHAS